MAELTVELVAVERRLWSGKATIVIAQTTEGELGILHGHEPMLGELVDGVVLIRTTDGETVAAAVHGGFLSVTGERVSVLAETAELSDEIDVEQAKQALDAADERERARATAQLRAVGEPG